VLEVVAAVLEAALADERCPPADARGMRSRSVFAAMALMSDKRINITLDEPSA
jgi:hypothetical protein